MVILVLKRPKAILFDVSGTVTKTSFIDRILVPYISANIRQYLEENWTTQMVKVDIGLIREDLKNNPVEGVKLPEDGDQNKAEMIEQIAKWVDTFAGDNTANQAFGLLRFHVWFDGFRHDKLQTPVYSDVAIQIAKWSGELGIRLYVFSNGWAEATKRFLGKTNHGNLNLLIEKHFDTSFGKLTESTTFTKILTEIDEKADDVCLLTKSAKEAKAAVQAGLTVVLVLTHRQDIGKLDDDAKKLPRVRSFNEIEFE